MDLRELKIGESYLFAEAPAWVNDTEIFKNPSPYMFHQLRRHLNFSNEIRGLLTQGGDVLMWDGKTTHDQVEAQLHLGKCTQFLVTKKGEFFVVQYGNDAEMKADSKAAEKNLPRPFEANPILRSLKLVFREDEKVAAAVGRLPETGPTVKVQVTWYDKEHGKGEGVGPNKEKVLLQFKHIEADDVHKVLDEKEIVTCDLVPNNLTGGWTAHHILRKKKDVSPTAKEFSPQKFD